jgi:protease-4
VREEFHSLNKRGSHKVAIISIEGVILDGDGFVKRQIDRAAEDEDVKAVVLRVNSPGGTVSGSDYIYHHLKKLRTERDIPLVVSMGGIAASGGYYVAMAVGDKSSDTIFAEPTTWTGSIGVMIPHYNAAKLLGEKLGVEEDSIVSHPLKGMGSFARDMTPEERKIFQQLVDEGFERFKAIIRSGRSEFEQDPAALEELATGQVFTADQAVESGLVDKIGFIEAAIDRAIALARLPKEDVRVVEYKREPTLADLLIGMQAKGTWNLELDRFLDMTVPRAYYLCTRLPPLVRSWRY